MLRQAASTLKTRTAIDLPATRREVLVPRGGARNYRRGVGILLLSRLGKAFVGRRIDTDAEAWQLPQGGIENGEVPREAALRELREEIGTDNVDFLHEVEGWLIYDLPPDLARRAWGGHWRGQQQEWFVMRFMGCDADINVATEHPEFQAWRWAQLEELPDLVVPFKRELYIDVLRECAAAHDAPSSPCGAGPHAPRQPRDPYAHGRFQAGDGSGRTVSVQLRDRTANGGC